jgi:Uroporphyrinogen-III synthase
VPSIRITPPTDGYHALDTAIADLEHYDWVIFTSTSGLYACFRRLQHHGR